MTQGAAERRHEASRSAKSEGDSLIEVMIALSITAIATLGLVATQTWLARSERDGARARAGHADRRFRR